MLKNGFMLGVLFYTGLLGEIAGIREDDKPICEIRGKYEKLSLYGYRGGQLENNYQRGKIQVDSSVYLSGFELRAGGGESPLFSGSEADIYRFHWGSDSIWLDWIDYLPVGEKMALRYVPVIRYDIKEVEGKWKIANPRIILDTKDLTADDFFAIKKDLGWDKLKPERMFSRDKDYTELRLMNAFVACLKYFPRYNGQFAMLEKGDGAVAELYDRYMALLNVLTPESKD